LTASSEARRLNTKKTYCVRQGQIEIGVIEHEGREFSAMGATVVGRHITGYTRLVDGDITLTTWCGQTMLASIAADTGEVGMRNNRLSSMENRTCQCKFSTR
jgi:hypothetical protein